MMKTDYFDINTIYFTYINSYIFPDLSGRNAKLIDPTYNSPEN